MPLTIRPATASDLDFLVQGNRSMALETEGRELPLETLRAGVQGGLQHPEYCRYYIAEEGGEPVAQAMVTYEWTDWRDGLIWWLQSVYVREDRRGQGVFRDLYNAIKQDARSDSQVRGLRLYVEQENTRAKEVYTRLGMRETDYLVYEEDWS